MPRDEKLRHPYPHLTAEYYRSIAAAFQTPMPDALPHRHQADSQICTNPECLADAGHQQYLCQVGNTLAEALCYDQNGNFRCRSSTQNHIHCARRPDPELPTNLSE